MESVSAGHSTIFASLPLHCASNTGDQAAVIRSTTCAGGTNGATGCGGASKGGLAGGAEAVGLILLLASIPSPFIGSARIANRKVCSSFWTARGSLRQAKYLLGKDEPANRLKAERDQRTRAHPREVRGKQHRAEEPLGQLF